jgi:hypothetical protein
MGQNLPLCAQLGATRSRQDESKEVGDVGSKRTSSRSKYEHHVWWGGLIFRLLSMVTEHSLSPTHDTHVALGLGTPTHPLGANCHSYLQH